MPAYRNIPPADQFANLVKVGAVARAAETELETARIEAYAAVFAALPERYGSFWDFYEIMTPPQQALYALWNEPLPVAETPRRGQRFPLARWAKVAARQQRHAARIYKLIQVCVRS